MYLRELLLTAALASVFTLATTGEMGARPVFRKPPPEGVVELIGVGINSLVELEDGSLLTTDGRVSTDEGKTWGEPRSFGEGVGGSGIIRLQSGTLALTSNSQIWLSHDAGNMWGEALPITMATASYGWNDTIIQLNSGRLLCPRTMMLGGYHPDDGLGLLPAIPETSYAWGTWKGLPFAPEGEGHIPQMDIAFVYHSDDEGKTWNPFKRYECLMGWFDFEGVVNGYCGVTPCDEPCVAETKDGEVLFFARSPVGRIVHSYSRDGGQTWTAVRPTELANSYSPARLKSIPETGDLLCVWNQISREEIRRGYRRGRLSAAISKDGGATWENFKTLELSEGLDDIDRISPEYPIRMVRARDHVGPLPENFATFSYPNVCFAGDRVYIMYGRGWIEESGGKAVDGGEQVLRIYPLEWFYQ